MSLLQLSEIAWKIWRHVVNFFFLSFWNTWQLQKSILWKKKKKNPHFPAWAVSSRLLNLISNVPSVTNLEMPARLGAPLSPNCTAVACLTFVNPDFRWAFAFIGREADVAPQVEKTNVLFLVLSSGPSQYPPIHDAFPCRDFSPLDGASVGRGSANRSSQAGKRPGSCLRKNKRECVLLGVSEGRNLWLVCAQNTRPAQSLWGAVPKKKKEKMLKLGHWMDGF